MISYSWFPVCENISVFVASLRHNFILLWVTRDVIKENKAISSRLRVYLEWKEFQEGDKQAGQVQRQSKNDLRLGTNWREKTYPEIHLLDDLVGITLQNHTRCWKKKWSILGKGIPAFPTWKYPKDFLLLPVCAIVSQLLQESSTSLRGVILFREMYR